MSNDARVPLFVDLSKAVKDKIAKEKQDALMADLRARGIIKDRTPEEEQKYKEAMEKYANETTPWFMIVGVVVGVLALMIALGGGITYFIVKYAG
jgi:farnesyl-diphosphate farnesyltransferase